MNKEMYLLIVALIALITLVVLVICSCAKVGKESDNKMQQLWNEKDTNRREENNLKENRKE